MLCYRIAPHPAPESVINPPSFLRQSAPPAATVPERIGKYEIIKEVARGSTGVVYLSHDPFYGRDVAIKAYHVDAGDDPERAALARKMFLSEAHMVGMLQHPYILPIYDAGEEGGRYYVVTEFVHGARTLSTYCKPDNLLRPDDVVELAFKCARALHYAHSRGVIHRDIKPSNIMLTTDNEVRIIDFGIAIVPGSEVSRIDGIAGSPSYMSPEQVQGLEVTSRSDLYSLGAVMYELLTGYRPFRAATLTRLLHQIVYATAPPIHTLRREVPEDMEAVVATAMLKDPERRYQTGQQFAAELTRVHQRLRAQEDRVDRQERYTQLRRLKFFHDFSHGEIQEVLRAGTFQDYAEGESIVEEGEIDDRFYVIVQGGVTVERGGRAIGELAVGECFGETSYVRGAKRTATIRAAGAAGAAGATSVLKVSSTLLEQASASCQLRFNKMFLRSLISRLQGNK